MSKHPNLDLDALSTDDLCREVLAAPGRGGDPVDTWLETQGIQPGTTRQRANHLYQQYCDFIATRPDMGRPMAIRIWGKVMARKFKSGKGNYGTFYYVSIERDGVIPP